MKFFKSTKGTIILLSFFYVSLVGYGFYYLQRSHFLNEEKLKWSDVIGAALAVATVFIGIVAIIFSHESVKLTQQAEENKHRTEEGQLYLRMMERYASDDMRTALRRLGSFKRKHQANLLLGISQWKLALDNQVRDAQEVEDARHKVKYFYRDLMQMHQGNYLSEKLIKRLLNLGGRKLFHDLVLQMESYANPLQFEDEFGEFKKFHDDLEKELQPVYKDPVTVCLIPARYNASRFPGKLMAKLKGKSVIRHTYDAVVEMNLFARVIVATDSEVIYQEITDNGGEAMMTREDHESGTDRIAEVAGQLNADIILNVQGDTPPRNKETLQQLLIQFRDHSVQVASVMQLFQQEEHIPDSNYVKVCVDKYWNALFFSRSVLPFPRNRTTLNIYYEHMGMYAFRKQALIDFTTWPVSPLEDAEKIECLRYLENGVPIRMVVTDFMGVEIDTPEDLERAETLL